MWIDGLRKGIIDPLRRMHGWTLIQMRKNQGFTYVKHSNVNLKKEQVMKDGSSRGNLFKQKERKWLRLKMIQAQVNLSSPPIFLPMPNTLISWNLRIQWPWWFVKAGKETPSHGGYMEHRARVAKLSTREVWNRPLTGEQQTESTAMQEWK